MVVVVAEALGVDVVVELAAGQGRSGQTSVGAGLIESQSVDRCEHTDVGQDRGIVLGVAVAVGRDVHHDRDVELRATIHHGLRILGHTAVEHRRGLLVLKADGIEVTSAQAAAATYAVGVIDLHLACCHVKLQSAIGALRLTELTAATHLLVDLGLATAMLLGLTRARAATHTDILDCTAEARHLVALEVAQTDEDVGIHNGATDLGGLHILATHDGDLDVVRTLQSVADQDRATHRQGRKAVLPRAVEVLEGVLAAAGVHRVAVGKEGLAAQLLHNVHNGARVVRAQVADVAQLAKVNLDGHELAIHINLADAGLADQLLEFLGESGTVSLGAEVGEVNFRFLHSRMSIVLQSKR